MTLFGSHGGEKRPQSGSVSKKVLLGRAMARSLSMLAIASAHLMLGVLGLLNRLEFTQHSSFPVLELAASLEIWVPIHSACGAWVLYVTFRNRFELQATSASAGFMATWAVFNFLWGLSTIRAVSLAGPVLAFSIAAVSYFMAITVNGRDKE